MLPLIVHYPRVLLSAGVPWLPALAGRREPESSMKHGERRLAPCLGTFLFGCVLLALAPHTAGRRSGTKPAASDLLGGRPAVRQQPTCSQAQLCVAQRELVANVSKLQTKSDEEKVIDTLLSPIIVTAIGLRLFASVVETSARKAPGWGSFVALLTLDSSTRAIVIALASVELLVLDNNGSRGTIEFNGLLAATVLDSAITVCSLIRLAACFACFVASRKCTLLNVKDRESEKDEWRLWDHPFSSDPLAVGIHDQAERSVRQHELINDAARLVLQNTEYVWGSLGLVMLIGSVLDLVGFALLRGGKVQKWWSTWVSRSLKWLAAKMEQRGGSRYFTRWVSGMSKRTNRMVFIGSWIGYLKREVHHRCVLALVLNGHYEDKHVVALDEELSRQGLPGTPLFVLHGQAANDENNVLEGAYFPPLAPTYGLSMSILFDRSLSAEAFCRRLLGVVDERLRVVSRVLDDGFFLGTEQTRLRERLQEYQYSIRSNAAVPSLALDPSRNASHVARVALFANTLRGLLLEPNLPHSPEEQERRSALAKDPVPTIGATADEATDIRSRVARWSSSVCQPRHTAQIIAADRQLGEEETQLSVELFYGLKVLSTRHVKDAFLLQKGYWWSRARLDNEALARVASEQDPESRIRTSGIAARSSSAASLTTRATRPFTPVAHTEPADVIPSSTPGKPSNGSGSPVHFLRILRHKRSTDALVAQPHGTPRSVANARPGQLPEAWKVVGAALQHFSGLGLLPWMVASDLGIEELDGVYVAMGRHHKWEAVEQVSDGGDGRLMDILFHIQDATTQLRKRLAEPRLDPLAEPTLTSKWIPRKLYPDVPVRLLDALNERSCTPLTHVPDKVAAVFTDNKRPAEPLPLDKMLEWWHTKWEAVLKAACERDHVPVMHVRRLPLVGFYPAMRLALDAFAGVWEPIEAAVLSMTASVVPRPGRSNCSEQRLNTMRVEMEAKKNDWPMHRVQATSTFATILLSASTTEASLYRRLLHVSDAEDRRARGASSASETAVGVRNAFASVALTGLLVASMGDIPSADAATQPGDGGTALHLDLPASNGGVQEQSNLDNFVSMNGV